MIHQVCKNVDAMDDESRGRLDVRGEFHLGDMVNCIQHGSLVMHQATTNASGSDSVGDTIMGEASSSTPSSSASSSSSSSNSTTSTIEALTSDVRGTLVFGTVSGRIGVVARLTETQFQFLLQLQTALNTIIVSVGNLSHDEWRSFHNDRRYTTKESKSKHFIDGDVIERLLDLSKDKQEAVAALMSKNVIPVGITKDDDSIGVARDISVETLVRIVEDLSRIH
jgi:DNA damage-binding protein 1